MLLAAALICVATAGCDKQPPASAAESLLSSDAVTPDPGGEQEPDAGEEQMIPIPGDRVADGVYPIEVDCNSSMFRIVDAQLAVADGEMSAVLTLSGTGYEKLYMGTGKEALDDSDDVCIYFVEDDEGKYTYTIPVAALDQETDVAAFSIRKQQWYDRILIFLSASLPDGAVAEQ